MLDAGVTLGEVAAAGGGVARGLQVGGVPLGDAAYMARMMDDKAAEIESYINLTVDQLRAEPHHLWACLYYGVKSKLDFWLQHVTPAESRTAAERVDAAMRHAAEVVWRQPNATSEGIVRRRLEHPVRFKGGGIRSRVRLAPAAFTACFAKAAREFTRETCAMPFFPMLSDLCNS